VKHPKLERCKSTQSIRKGIRAEPRLTQKLQEWTKEFKISVRNTTCDKIFISVELA